MYIFTHKYDGIVYFININDEHHLLLSHRERELKTTNDKITIFYYTEFIYDTRSNI